MLDYLSTPSHAQKTERVWVLRKKGRNNKRKTGLLCHPCLRACVRECVSVSKCERKTETKRDREKRRSCVCVCVWCKLSLRPGCVREGQAWVMSYEQSHTDINESCHRYIREEFRYNVAKPHQVPSEAPITFVLKPPSKFDLKNPIQFGLKTPSSSFSKVSLHIQTSTIWISNDMLLYIYLRQRDVITHLYAIAHVVRHPFIHSIDSFVQIYTSNDTSFICHCSFGVLTYDIAHLYAKYLKHDLDSVIKSVCVCCSVVCVLQCVCVRCSVCMCVLQCVCALQCMYVCVVAVCVCALQCVLQCVYVRCSVCMYVLQCLSMLQCVCPENARFHNYSNPNPRGGSATQTHTHTLQHTHTHTATHTLEKTTMQHTHTHTHYNTHTYTAQYNTHTYTAQHNTHTYTATHTLDQWCSMTLSISCSTSVFSTDGACDGTRLNHAVEICGLLTWNSIIKLKHAPRRI